MTEADDRLLQLYNRELIALSSQVETPKRLERPDASAQAVSIICGSEVIVELALEEGRIVDIGYEVDACSLTKAVMAIVVQVARGKTAAELAAAGETLKAMLSGAPAPEGEWSGLKILGPVADYNARHESIMLPFVAIDKAFRSIQ